MSSRKNSITVRGAAAYLFTSGLSLLSAVLTLTAALVRLTAAGVTWAASRVESSRLARAERQGVEGKMGPEAPKPALRLVKPTVEMMTPRAAALAMKNTANVVTASTTTVTTVGPSQTEKLTTALVGLGFRVPAVKAFVGSLGERAETEALEALIKDGLRTLTAKAV